MSIIADTVNYIREGNKELLVDFIADRIILMENDINDLNTKLNNINKIKNELMNLDLTNKPLLLHTLCNGYNQQVEIQGKAYDLRALINSLPA